jgi:hypothetical protein
MRFAMLMIFLTGSLRAELLRADLAIFGMD